MYSFIQLKSSTFTGSINSYQMKIFDLAIKYTKVNPDFILVEKRANMSMGLDFLCTRT